MCLVRKQDLLHLSIAYLLHLGPAWTYWIYPEQAEGNQPFDLHPIPAAKVTPDLQSYYFPNVCGSSDSPPSASQGAVVGNAVTGLSSPWPGNTE